MCVQLIVWFFLLFGSAHSTSLGLSLTYHSNKKFQWEESANRGDYVYTGFLKDKLIPFLNFLQTEVQVNKKLIVDNSKSDFTSTLGICVTLAVFGLIFLVCRLDLLSRIRTLFFVGQKVDNRQDPEAGLATAFLK